MFFYLFYGREKMLHSMAEKSYFEKQNKVEDRKNEVAVI